jgi:hypothetical protein
MYAVSAMYLIINTILKYNMQALKKMFLRRYILILQIQIMVLDQLWHLVRWVRRLATRGSMVSAHLIRVLALRLKLQGTCPITPLHIEGKENSMTDIPSRSFLSEPKWFCKTNNDLLTLYNTLLPLPRQNSWTVFQISYAVGTRVTSVLQTKDFTLDEWRRL